MLFHDKKVFDSQFIFFCVEKTCNLYVNVSKARLDNLIFFSIIYLYLFLTNLDDSFYIIAILFLNSPISNLCETLSKSLKTRQFDDFKKE